MSGADLNAGGHFCDQGFLTQRTSLVNVCGFGRGVNQTFAQKSSFGTKLVLKTNCCRVNASCHVQLIRLKCGFVGV